MENIIEVKNLIKSFKGFNAVDDISFEVKRGEIFGFLGVNGAGKSTTIGMLCTLTKMTQGQVKICGYELGKEDQLIRNKIGIVFQDNSLDNELTVKENLIIRGYLYENNKKVLHENLKSICKSLKIECLLNKKFKNLSGGQKRICDIARALIHKPEILFLDEPTTGLDPKTRKNMWESIQNIKKENNMTIFLTTHYMEEAAKADYISIIDGGKIIANGTPYKLKEEYSKDKLKIECNDKEKVKKILNEYNLKFYDFENRINIELNNTIEGIFILQRIKDSINTFEVVQGTIEDAFLNITGNVFKEA